MPRKVDLVWRNLTKSKLDSLNLIPLFPKINVLLVFKWKIMK